jgi:hypothetical protein
VLELRRDLGLNLSLLNSLLKTSLVLPTSLLKTFLVLLASLLKKPVDCCDCCAAILAKYSSRPGGVGKGGGGYSCTLTVPQLTFLVWEDDEVPD